MNKDGKRGIILVSVAVCVFVLAAAAIGICRLRGNDFTEGVGNKASSVTANTRTGMENEALMKPVAAAGFPEGVHAVIFPRVELLSGVLSQTSWIENRGPRGSGNKYYRELKEYFSKYKGHKAVQIAEKLTKMGFTYDAPPNFILSLKELPSLVPTGEYSDYLVTRAQGKKNLEEFTTALADLSKEADFPGFFEAHRAELQGYIDKSLIGFEAAKVLQWLQKFYGEVNSKGDFYIVFAPAMFPQGGYGASIPGSDGKLTVYQVIRENGVSQNEAQFPSGRDLELLALHEWGHAYVNPSIDANSTLFEKNQIDKLYKPVEEIMKKQAYGSVNTFMNEQVLRSAVAVAARELYGETVYDIVLKYERQNGFYLTAFTAEQLEYYEKNRNQYKNFKEFVPYLLEQYNKNLDSLLAQAPK